MSEVAGDTDGIAAKPAGGERSQPRPISAMRFGTSSCTSQAPPTSPILHTPPHARSWPYSSRSNRKRETGSRDSSDC